MQEGKSHCCAWKTEILLAFISSTKLNHIICNEHLALLSLLYVLWVVVVCVCLVWGVVFFVLGVFVCFFKQGLQKCLVVDAFFNVGDQQGVW